MKTILKIIKNLFIVIISLLLAIVLSSSILGGIGYSLYNDYHMDYVAIDQNWNNVVESFNYDLLRYNKKLEKIKQNNTPESETTDDTEKNKAIKKIESLLQNASQSLKYEDKYEAYKELIKNEDILNKTLDLNVTFDDNKKEIEKFNQVIKNWNKRKRNVGHRFVDRLLLYKEWETLNL